MEGGRQHDDHFSIVSRQAVLGDDAWHLAALAQQPEQPQRGVGDDARVDLARGAKAQALDRVDAGTAPRLAQLGVRRDARPPAAGAGCAGRAPRRPGRPLPPTRRPPVLAPWSESEPC
jgi:hypothetical protein